MKRSIACLTILAVVFALFAMPAFAVGPNLVENGDFEAGNTDFYSGYTYLDPSLTGTWTLGPEFMYTIGKDPNLYHSAWTSYGDHTTGDGDMMIVNSQASTPLAVLWGQDDIELEECQPEIYPLYAAQEELVGNVLVKRCDGQICVKFVLNGAAISAGWLITETHVAIGDTPADIPHTNKHNPIPGQFPEGENFEPGVEESGWYCLEYDGSCDDPIVVVAAHAKIEMAEISHEEDTSFCIVSDEETEYKSGENWVPAIPAWVHPQWESQYGTPNPFEATWIWNSYRTIEPVLGEIVEFRREFEVVGTPTAAELTITADNGYEVSLNGDFVGSAQVFGEWMTSNFTETFVTSSGWAPPPEFYDVDVVEGLNELSIFGVNEYMGPLDGQAEGTIDSNPGGVVYRLCVTAGTVIIDQEYQEESAWGAMEQGGCQFQGKNWATYIKYRPECNECDTMYEFSFWAANAHPDAPAELEVTINGDVIGTADLSLIANPGNWMQYTFAWDSGCDVDADITIVNLNNEAWGADFTIDDIFFGKQ